MKVLFIHPNFPAQFRHLAGNLGHDAANEVMFLCNNPRPEWAIPGVRKVAFKAAEGNAGGDPLLRSFAEQVAMGEAVYRQCRQLRQAGFVPDVIVAHSGWGSSYFVRDAFPQSPMLCFFEWYYNARGADATFDPDTAPGERGLLRLRTRNATILDDLAHCACGYTPTRWQAAQFPVAFHKKLAVLHDGIDTGYFAPVDRYAALSHLNAQLGLDLTHQDDIITWATRGMEPYRGFPQFMEALPGLFAQRPRAKVLIAGEDRACYGPPPAPDKTWKQVMLARIQPRLSSDQRRRLHFTDRLPYRTYKSLLQASSVHVYLSRPFVLSWSLLEAMSCGCAVVASDTPPVREVVRHGQNGLLFDFFSPEKLVETVIGVLESKEETDTIRQAARTTIEECYALKRMLPRQLQIVQALGRLGCKVGDLRSGEQGAAETSSQTIGSGVQRRRMRKCKAVEPGLGADMEKARERVES